MIFPLLDQTNTQNNDLVERPNDSNEYIQAWAVAGRHLQNIFNKFNTMDNVSCEGFNWIRTDLSSPRFDSMNFRYKDHVFSVLIDFIDLAEDRFIG